MRAKPLRKITWEEAPVWLRCLGVVAIGNFLTFFVGVMLLGGDALNGKIEKGHYFLRSHAQLTEVSAATFHYSLIHTTTALIGMVVLFIAAALFNSLRP